MLPDFHPTRSARVRSHWNPRTTGREMFRRFPVRRWCCATIPCQTIRRPNRPQPSAPIASCDRGPSRRDRVACGQLLSAPTNCLLTDLPGRAASSSSADSPPRRCGPMASATQRNSRRPSAKTGRSPAATCRCRRTEPAAYRQPIATARAHPACRSSTHASPDPCLSQCQISSVRRCVPTGSSGSRDGIPR